MNDDDFRDVCAMLAMNGLLAQGLTDYSVANVAFKMADLMLQQRKKQGEDNEEADNGIAAVAPKRTRKR